MNTGWTSSREGEAPADSNNYSVHNGTPATNFCKLFPASKNFLPGL